MNLFTNWIPEYLRYALGWTLVHSLWQILAMGVVLWIGLKLSSNKSAAFKYNLGLIMLGTSFLLTVATFTYELAAFTPAPVLEAWLSNLSSEESNQFTAIYTAETLLNQSISWIDQQLPILVNFWFFGTLLFLFRLFNSLTELRMLRKAKSLEIDFEVEKTFNRLLGKFGLEASLSLKVIESGSSPITFGYFKPVVLIPVALIFHLTPAQLEAIIAHELAHVKRNDYLINLIQSTMEVLFFYHPSYWWMSQTIKELRENVADDLAVEVGISPKELAYSLAEVLNFRTQNPPELALPASKKRNPTLQRIKRIMGQPAQNYPQNPIISIPMLLTLLFSAGLIASAQHDSPDTFEAITPNVSLQNSEISDIESTSRFFSQLDTIKEPPIVKKGHSSNEWSTNSGEKIIVKRDGNNSYTYRITGDTLITNGDTVILDGNQHFVFRYKDGVDWANMPKMDFNFQMAPMAPDFPDSQIPPLNMGGMPPMPVMPSMPEMPPIPPMPEISEIEFFGSGERSTVYRNGKNGLIITRDTTDMTKNEKESWAKEQEKQANDWAKKSEELMKSWEPQMKEWEQKMEAWQKSNEPKMKKFEEKMAVWQKSNTPKLKEFEEKMKAWEKAQEPKMKEFEKQMEEWQEKFQPKMEEFQRKMKIWQEDNFDKLDEFQEKLEEQLKKKDNVISNPNSVNKSTSTRTSVNKSSNSNN
jgi:beta-lactamase regulating signal transducer with metallopeptidase domain